jgi:magnesium transporter
MARPHAVFPPDMTVARATEEIRALVSHLFVTYAYVVDAEGRLLGVVVMREMLLAEPGDRLDAIMLRNPFSLRPDATQMDAIKEVVGRHYPVYPVCDAEGRLVGLVRGSVLFERQTFEITAQAGTMVGVEKEERLATPWKRSFRSRHPWLQLNLLTAFVAAGVVGAFEGTIDRIVALAVFLPVLAGQSGNTGCQALAVALRGMTLGELKPGSARAALGKEALLGLLNGLFVGLTAGAGMVFYANMSHTPNAWTLGFVVATAMTCACVISGVAGVTIPVVLKRLGADPATASSIFLTTATDVASMGIFLSLATVLA